MSIGKSDFTYSDLYHVAVEGGVPLCKRDLKAGVQRPHGVPPPPYLETASAYDSTYCFMLHGIAFTVCGGVVPKLQLVIA